MINPCIKTGFQAYLDPRNEWLYGDAYRVGDVYLFRVCETSLRPIRDRKHFTINNWRLWFDSHITSMDSNSTVVCNAKDVIDHGYEGVPI